MLTPENKVLNSPRVIDMLAIESSPIYQTLDASVSVSGGSFTLDGYDYEVSSVSKTFDQLERERAVEVSLSGGMFYVNEEVNIYGIRSYYDGLNDLLFASNAGKFVALNRNLDNRLNAFSLPFSPPEFLTPNGSGSFFHRFVDAVEITDPDGTPPTNVKEKDVLVSVSAPVFTGNLLDGNLKMIIDFSASVQGWFNTNSGSVIDSIEIDCAAWGTPEFRDIRGTYGTTSTDDNGISYTWSITIG